MKKMRTIFEYADKKTGVWAAMISCLTLFSILAACVPGWYESLPSMEELVCGQVIWTGYEKQVDLTIVKCVILGLPVLFILFYGIACFCRWKEWIDSNERVLIAGGYLIGVVLVLLQREIAWQYLISYAVLLIGYIVCRRGVNPVVARHRFFAAILSAYMMQLMCVSIIFLLSFRFAKMTQLWKQYSNCVLVIGAIAFLLLCIWKKQAEVINKYLLYVQIVLPAGLMGMIHFRYRYETDGNLMELFYSGKWKAFCFAFALILCAFGAWQMIGKKQMLTWTTFVMTAVIRVFMQPDGLMNIDFFHNGELTLPSQQLISYGRMPYKGVIPIHGMCDYFYGMVDYLFFDGIYLSLNAAKVVGNILMAVLLATVIYFFVQSRYQGLMIVYLFMPYLVNQAGMRYLFLFIMFFVLFSHKLRDGFWYIYAWVLLSICATAWNASIGGAAAAAFLPVVLWRMGTVLPGQIKKMFRDRKKEIPGKMAALVMLLILGLCYVPMFIQIVVYLLDNAGTTLFVNGMEMFQDTSEASGLLVPGLWGSGGDFFMVTFGFSVPILLCLLYVCKKGMGYAREYLITLFVCFMVLINYAFVRFDEGLRSTVMGMFFTLLITVTLLFEEAAKEYRTGYLEKGQNSYGAVTAYVACLGFLLCLTDSSPWVNAESLPLCLNVPSYVETTIMGQTVEDPVVYVTGESVEIPNLGNGFIQGNTLNSLRNVSKVVEAYRQEGKTCLDLTNEIANQVVFDLDNFWPYTSAYNISNDRMQKKAIAQLKNQLPDMILVSPEIVFDDAPFSLRSPILYQYLMQQGYETYKYENVIYLVRGENPVEGGEQNEAALAQLWHKTTLGYLPRVWGLSEQDQLLDITDQLPTAKIQDTESGFDLVFEKPMSGSEVTLLKLKLAVSKEYKSELEKNHANDNEKDGQESTSMTVTFDSDLTESDKGTSGEELAENRYAFALDESGDYLVPLGLSPYFTKTAKINRISFTYNHEKCQIDTKECSVSYYRFKEE